jgi:hypothetical protein
MFYFKGYFNEVDEELKQLLVFKNQCKIENEQMMNLVLAKIKSISQ